MAIMTKSRIFLFLLLSFVAGVFSASFLNFSPLVLGGIFILGIFLIAVFWQNKFFVLAGFLILVFGLALWRTQAVLENDNSPVTRFNNQGKVLIRGQIIDDPERRSGNQKFVVSVESLEAAGLRENISGKILVTGRRFPEYRYGDRLEIFGKLSAPETSDDFDYAAYLAKDDIYSLIYYPQIEKIGDSGSPVYNFLFSVKNKFEKVLGLILPEPHSSFLAALLLGVRKTLPSDLVENFNITGTTHIVALSGFNITIVSSFIISLLGFFLIRRNIAFWLAVFGIAGFALMTGASASVVRAALMGILILWAQRESRLYSITNSIVFAGTVMLFLNPKILRYDAGFQLSFLATLGLIYISPIFQKWLQNFRFPQNLKEVFYLTLSAQIATLPLIIYHFGRMSLVALPANLAILLIIPLTMIFGFLAGGVGLVSVFLGKIAASIAFILLSYEMAVINLFAKIPLASVAIASFSFIWVVLIYCFLVLWIIRETKRARMGS